MRIETGLRGFIMVEEQGKFGEDILRGKRREGG